ncbi:VOC family protein [Polaribacter ponticola]|uniref:VOC family protein n=1 Tax=Polaribacter ponticola TaxID=2978475 RepID=A0ABT5S631_9FLAO|nr:VOC family protein [Polaribacter sp. MSW5]MDD7913294.1 VOC family protein [Polaribacter sp. MSW5]
MKNNSINYIEFYTHNINETKLFYENAFSWKFTDYGATYIAFSESGLEGGFELTSLPIINGALVVLYSDNLKAIQEKIISFGGKISKEIFEFPGGKRFQFLDPTGNELAVWSNK